MYKKIITTNTCVEIQGSEVLQLIRREKNRAIYRLVDFKSPTVQIIDYRTSILEALDNALHNGIIEEFPYFFSTPSFIEVSQNQQGNYLVVMDTPQLTDPQFMLWISYGLINKLPVYPYIFYEIVPIKGNAYALFSLYRMQQDQAISHLRLPSLAFRDSRI